ncbi:MAG: serine/threonine protein kinase [Ignavibacteria bacterium]|nr:serine/threonine protein kinase [Ignavibacteria bacterium]
MIGKKIQNYEIISLIGEGGMGKVYLARHLTLERKVAVKVLNPEFVFNEELRQRFINEAKVLSTLTHQNIVTLYDFTEFEDNLVIIMEYIEGNSLEHIVRNLTGAIPEARSINIFGQILSAFSFAHKKGIVHRDIKPSNILLQAGDVPKILDFGIAKILHGDINLTKTGTKIGTIYYMSPEQILGRPIDFRTDIYSLGVTLFEMLCGKKPYDENITSEYLIQEKIVKEPLPPIRTIYPAVSERMEYIVNKATSKYPDDRFRSCDEFREALQPGIQQTTVISAQPIYEQKTVVSGTGSTLPPPPVFEKYDYTSNQIGSVNSSQQYQSPYGSNVPRSKPPKKTGYIIGGIIIVLIIISLFVLGGMYVASLLNEEKDDPVITEKRERTDKTEKTEPKRTKKSEEETSLKDDYGTDIKGIRGAKLYFCEDYKNGKEVNVSSRFTTGWLTVMVDLRPADVEIGVKSVYIEIVKIKNSAGESIPEKLVKTVDFSVEPDFNYIYFQNKKELKFDSPGTYRVSLFTSRDKLIVSNTIEIISR